MKLIKNQKVYIKGKSIGRSFKKVLEISEKKNPVPMLGNKYFGYWQHSRKSTDDGLINIVDYRPDTYSGDFYKDKDIELVETDFIPEELFEI